MKKHANWEIPKPISILDWCMKMEDMSEKILIKQ